MAKSMFIPMLMIPEGTMSIDFYKQAFNAVEIRRWTNDNGSIHVAELSIDGAMFRVHEEDISKGKFSPAVHQGITADLSLIVDDVDLVMNTAIAAGAKLISAARDFDYGYRQGELQDPFGHQWTIEKIL